jgi:hypothetical protein
MLKSELMAPASVDDSKTPDQLSAKQDMADKAAASLQASITALGPGLLDQSVLNDVAVEDLMQYLGLVNPPWARSSSGDGSAAVAAAEGGGSQEQEGWHLPQRAQRRLACIANCVAAVRAGHVDHCETGAVAAAAAVAVAAVRAGQPLQKQGQPQSSTWFGQCPAGLSLLLPTNHPNTSTVMFIL